MKEFCNFASKHPNLCKAILFGNIVLFGATSSYAKEDNLPQDSQSVEAVQSEAIPSLAEKLGVVIAEQSKKIGVKEVEAYIVQDENHPIAAVHVGEKKIYYGEIIFSEYSGDIGFITAHELGHIKLNNEWRRRQKLIKIDAALNKTACFGSFIFLLSGIALIINNNKKKKAEQENVKKETSSIEGHIKGINKMSRLVIFQATICSFCLLAIASHTSKNEEFKADEIAAELTSPQHGVAFFEKLQSRTEDVPEKTVSQKLLSLYPFGRIENGKFQTHPTNEKRIEALLRLQKELDQSQNPNK